jgi:ribosomal protein L7/L12
MPNRIIKESICSSDDIDILEPLEEILFYRIIVNCDDYGIMDARPKMLKAKCFPLKNISESELEKLRNKLWEIGLIKLYAHDSKCYLLMSTWEKHQQIRAKRSKFPLPTDEGSEILDYDIICNQMKSNDIKCTRNPIQSESNPNPNPNPIQLNSLKEERVKEIIPYQEIFNLYVEQKIVDHKTLTDKMKAAIKKALSKFSAEEIKLAITRYGEMYNNKANSYAVEYCKYKWTLDELLTRDKGISEFLDEGGKWIRYQEAFNNKSNTKGTNGKSSAWNYKSQRQYDFENLEQQFQDKANENMQEESNGIDFQEMLKKTREKK